MDNDGRQPVTTTLLPHEQKQARMFREGNADEK